MLWVLFVGLVWVLPIYVAHRIGAPKNRNGLAWGIFLGWLGVLAVSLLKPQPKKYTIAREDQKF
jgi:threonine/homoserine efflux transporter RhtA